MLQDVAGATPAVLSKMAGRARITAATGELDPFHERDGLTVAEFRRVHSWCADYMESLPDPDLERALLEAMPDPEHARSLVRARSCPHPITVGTEDWWNWSCDNCGELHECGDGSTRLHIGWVDGYSQLEAPITYCRACVASALAQFPQ
ncbi:MAG: hypothetical protein U0Q22_03615 [Acidimicrobiales bacterium]